MIMKINYSWLVRSILVVLITAVSLQAYNQEEVEYPVKIDREGFMGTLVQTGRFYIGGQPDRKGLQWIREQGVKMVINLRTQEEMDNREAIPFDEEALVDSLGMEYVRIPQGGEEHPYEPGALVHFAEAVGKAKGKVLVHCTVGWRASHMWGAYLVRYRGLTIPQALEHAKAINFGSIPILDYLGKGDRLDLLESGVR
jgi:uncharacterized protein (TIGR01244 family)